MERWTRWVFFEDPSKGGRLLGLKVPLFQALTYRDEIAFACR
ncbi:hypothetical protein [Pseudarthrobacter sp. WHRI 8279]